MRFDDFARQTRHFGVFESSLVWPFYDTRQQAQRQLTDWCRSGKLLQLRRGIYAFPPPYQDRKPLRFVVANRLVRPSYISLQSALSYYGLIPEHVAAVTSVTTGRPVRLQNAFGRFQYRHIKNEFFEGYRFRQFSSDQWAFIAGPEKALLDLVYLTPGGDTEAYIRELRLQNLEVIDPERLVQMAERAARPKLLRILPHLRTVIREQEEGYLAL